MGSVAATLLASLMGGTVITMCAEPMMLPDLAEWSAKEGIQTVYSYSQCFLFAMQLSTAACHVSNTCNLKSSLRKVMCCIHSVNFI